MQNEERNRKSKRGLNVCGKCLRGSREGEANLLRTRQKWISFPCAECTRRACLRLLRCFALGRIFTFLPFWDRGGEAGEVCGSVIFPPGALKKVFFESWEPRVVRVTSLSPAAVASVASTTYRDIIKELSVS